MKIVKITKEEAMITARLYLASLVVNYGGFGSDDIPDNVAEKVQKEIFYIVHNLIKKYECEIPLTTKDCVDQAKNIIKQKKEQQQTKKLNKTIEF